MDRYKIRSADVAGYQVIPMIGGMVTVRERPTIEFGHKSLVQNMRCWQPGFETRKGYSKHNSTAYNASSNSPLNIPMILHQPELHSGRLFMQVPPDRYLHHLPMSMTTWYIQTVLISIRYMQARTRT
jgi:hypothetical protein